MKTDVKTFVKQVGNAPVPDQWDDIRSRIPRSGAIETVTSVRHRAAVIAVALLVAFVSLAFVLRAFRVVGGDVSGAATSTSGGGSSTDVYFDDVRLSVDVPTGWTVADHNITPWLSKPSEILSVGTFEMPVSHDPGDPLRVSDAPVAPAALAAMAGTDAFISVQAAGPTDQPDDRPPSFRDMPARSCCSAQTGDYPFKWWWIPFIDGGRAYYLFVAVGNDANVATQDQAWAIADSLTFSGGSAPSSSEVP
jgi:hypothetical protein